MVKVPVAHASERTTAGQPWAQGASSTHAAETSQLALTLGCNAAGKTVVRHRYMAYPLSVSPVFRLEGEGPDLSRRAYVYRMNKSPGLLAGDSLSMSVQLEEGSSLYLADQAATKVHQMARPGEEPPQTRSAQVHYDVAVGKGATLEFLPEPLILFAESTLKQTTDLTLHAEAGLSWGEIILPGRLARAEVYQFREYWSKLRVRSPDRRVWFADAMKLLGKHNRFAQQPLFADGAVLGTLVLVLPQAICTSDNLTSLSQQVDGLASDSLNLASSILPEQRGLFIRAIASTTREMQAGFKAAANCVRSLRNQPPLPYSV